MEASSNPAIEARLDDLAMVVAHLVANPPDGLVTLIVTGGGAVYAEWTSTGRKTSVGPAQTRSLPQSN